MAKSILISSNNQEEINNHILKIKSELQIEDNNIVDYKQIDQEKTKSIGIAQIKDLKSWAITKPHFAPNKLAVILQSHLLTIESQNALLKIIEEPNDSITFILSTDNYRKLLETIQSRCEKINLTNDELNSTSNFSQLSLANQFKLIEGLVSTKDTITKGQKIDEFIESLLLEYREKLLQDISNKSHQKALELILTANKQLKANVPAKTVLDNLVINLQEAI